MAEEVSSHRFFRRLVSVVEGEVEGVVAADSDTVFLSAVVVEVVDRE